MAAIDGILRIVLEQRGDQLVLGTDEEPVALADQRRLLLTMPKLSQGALRSVLRDTGAEAGQLAADGLQSWVYESSELGSFRVELEGSLADGARARVRFVPRGAASTEPTGAGRTGSTEPGSEIPSYGALRVEVSEAVPRVTQAVPSTSARGTLSDPVLVELLRKAVARRASDVHLASGEVPSFRVDGSLVSSGGASLDPRAWLGAEAAARVEAGRALDIAWGLPTGERFRASFYATVSGMAVAIRVLPREIPSLASLGLPPQVEALAEIPNGLVLVTGSTGSGKSTTLAALLTVMLSRSPGLCITLEAPIEYRLGSTLRGALVRQREVGTHVVDFPSGLRDALREDPDVLLVGEMRDPESIALAITAAETGHLVMSSVHSRSSLSAIHRVIDAFPAGAQRQVRAELADSLRAVVAQTLLPRADGAGRVPVVEVLRVTHAVAHLIREGKLEQLPSALQAGRDTGMLAFERHLADRVREGSVSLAVARGATPNRETLEQFLRPGVG